MLLVVDSATAACSVALFDPEGRLIADAHEVVGRGHAERLVPMIADLLDGRRPDAILVDCGPGSFTGVRVGLAAAHGLAIGWGVTLAGFSAMTLVAAAARAPRVVVAMQGGHGELFVQSFADAPLAHTSALHSLSPADAAAAFAEERVVGTGAQALVAARGQGTWESALPRAADALLLPQAYRSLPPAPIYGRAPDAKPGAAP